METTPSSGAFTGATLAEKLNKLNASQQSIETLSHWCIFHRKKAKEIVDTWASKLRAAPKEQRVPFLYLANDILQNSRRKGPEFVNAFWTVLPAVLRDVLETGDDAVRNSANRLVNIWEERRVFGSRGQSLRDELLGRRPQSPKREAKHASTLDPQVFEGTWLERVAKSYQAAQEKAADEHVAHSKCSAAFSLILSLEKEAEDGAANGDMHTADELLEQELVMRQCIEQLEACEKSHVMLCSEVKDALVEQETKLERLRTQIQTAQSQIQQARNVRQRLASRSFNDYSPGGAAIDSFDEEEAEPQEHVNQAPRNMGSETHTSSGSASASNIAGIERSAEALESSQPPTTTPASTLSTAAEIAAKLSASASSAAMLTSVLSSLAAEEAGNGMQTANYGMEGVQKRPRIEKHAEPPSVPYQLPPHLSQFLGSTMFPPGYPYQQQAAAVPPPPPMQSHMMMNQQHPMGPPPPPMPPGCNPSYQFQQSPSPYYSPPPLPAPPAPAPRQ